MSDKEQKIENLLNDIDSWDNEIDSLEDELGLSEHLADDYLSDLELEITAAVIQIEEAQLELKELGWSKPTLLNAQQADGPYVVFRPRKRNVTATILALDVATIPQVPRTDHQKRKKAPNPKKVAKRKAARKARKITRAGRK